MSEETLRKVSTTIRADEVEIIDAYAAKLPGSYAGNRSAAIRELLRLGMDQQGIAVRPLGPGDE